MLSVLFIYVGTKERSGATFNSYFVPRNLTQRRLRLIRPHFQVILLLAFVAVVMAVEKTPEAGKTPETTDVGRDKRGLGYYSPYAYSSYAPYAAYSPYAYSAYNYPYAYSPYTYPTYYRHHYPYYHTPYHYY